MVIIIQVYLLVIMLVHCMEENIARLVFHRLGVPTLTESLSSVTTLSLYV
jgi:hypothetical protein